MTLMIQMRLCKHHSEILYTMTDYPFFVERSDNVNEESTATIPAKITKLVVALDIPFFNYTSNSYDSQATSRHMRNQP